MNEFADLIGQDRATELLSQGVKRSRIAPAYLFVGAAGVGRSLAAKRFSELLIGRNLEREEQLRAQRRLQAGNHPDLLWVQPEVKSKRQTASKINIEQVRGISEFLSRPPLEADRCVVIIEEAQTMTEAAANALLKTLEEPGRATLILIVPSSESLLPTLVSRCQIIPFERLSLEATTEVLTQQNYPAILQHPLLLDLAQGSPGEAIASFAHLQAIEPELLDKLTVAPSSPLHALELAKAVNQLELSTQLWLVDYLQYCYWHSRRQQHLIVQLETARQCLLGYVQPRLVWECTFVKFFQVKNSTGYKDV